MIDKVKAWFTIYCRMCTLSADNLYNYERLRQRTKSICEREELETINHLFLHCKLTGQLWRIFLNLKGIMWVMPRDTLEVLENWNKYSFQSEQKERWKFILACIWWTVWKERNQSCFEDNHSSIRN